MKVLFSFIIILFFQSHALANGFDYALAHYYAKSAKDDSLAYYLKVSENELSKPIDKINHTYFSALLARYTGRTEDVFKFLNKAMKLYDRHELPDTTLAAIHDQYAIFYRYDFPQIAHSHIDKSIRIKKAYDLNNEIAKSYIIKGNIFYGNDSLDRVSDSCMHYWNLAKELNTDEDNRLLILSSMATLDISVGNQDPEILENTFLELIELHKKRGSLDNAVHNQVSLLAFYTDHDEFEKSQIVIDTLLPYLHENGHRKYVLNVIRGHIKYYKKIEDYKSVSIWQDSMEYWVKKTEHKTLLNRIIAEHEYKTELSKAEAISYRNKLWVSILGGSTASLLFFLFGYNQYSKVKGLAIQQELETTRVHAALNAAKAKIEGEQKERQAIASVLHDKVASLLTAADVHLKVAEKMKGTSSLTKASEILKDVNIQVRDLSHQLVSPTLKKYGLEAALESLVHKTDSQELRVVLDSRIGSLRFSETKETFLYRCTAELLHNVMKHSNADHCHIELEKKESMIIITTIDNGHSDDEIIKGYGLTHINNRSEAFGGSFTIEKDNRKVEARIEMPI